MKRNFLKRPPMGWNSYDCYGAAVNEEQLLGNAEYMAKNMLQYGWEYVVCDIQWYEPTADSFYYHNFADLCMDEYSRLIPAENRFPSSKGGKGFREIADRIHGMGLKFGIHIMRGVPRQAVHRNTPILANGKTARDIAQQFSLCSWNTDMYGVDAGAEGAQEYYDSLFALYSQWGVDFVKVDDACVTEFKPQEPYSAKDEIEMIRKAMDRCGREMVFSLSPGPAPLEQAEHLDKHANMWRMTGDFWDQWEQLYGMFDRCRDWAPYVKEGGYPDCDMLPLGHIAIPGFGYVGTDRMTRFTKPEQLTLMTLWSIFRSPLMVGGELRDNDEWTYRLLTNEEVLRLNHSSHGAREAFRKDGGGTIVWMSDATEGGYYVAIFNVEERQRVCELSLGELGLEGEYGVRSLWEKKEVGRVDDRIRVEIEPHGAKLYYYRRPA